MKQKYKIKIFLYIAGCFSALAFFVLSSLANPVQVFAANPNLSASPSPIKVGEKVIFTVTNLPANKTGHLYASGPKEIDQPFSTDSSGEVLLGGHRADLAIFADATQVGDWTAYVKMADGSLSNVVKWKVLAQDLKINGEFCTNPGFNDSTCESGFCGTDETCKEKITYTLTVINSSGGGTIISNPTGINCGINCTATFDSGANVTLIATALFSYKFKDWSGACSGSSVSCALIMTADKTTTANYIINLPDPGPAPIVPTSTNRCANVTCDPGFTCNLANGICQPSSWNPQPPILPEPHYPSEQCPAGLDYTYGLCLPHSRFSGGFTTCTNLTCVVTKAIDLFLYFAGVIAVIFLIIGGYWYITSAGNEESAEKGKKTLINSIIGLVVVILSYAIITVISGTLMK